MPTHEPWRVPPPAGPADLAELCAQAQARVRVAGGVLTCDVSALVTPGLAAVAALARIRLIGQRQGCRVRLRHASPELLSLLALAGLVFECDLSELGDLS